MIDFIQGKIIEKTPTYIIVECCGKGYEIHVSLNTFAQIKSAEQKIYTHMVIREDAHLLYGFAKTEERKLFRLLISVSGIGTNTARVILSSLSPSEIINAILLDEIQALTTIKGIGIKTAKRLVLDLKDKVFSIEATDKALGSQNFGLVDEAIQALEVLGYNKKTSKKVVEQILSKSNITSVEKLIKLALNNL